MLIFTGKREGLITKPTSSINNVCGACGNNCNKRLSFMNRAEGDQNHEVRSPANWLLVQKHHIRACSVYVQRGLQTYFCVYMRITGTHSRHKKELHWSLRGRDILGLCDGQVPQLCLRTQFQEGFGIGL